MSNKLQIQTRIIAVMWGAQIPNYLDFEWHSKTQQPDHSKSGKIAPILDFYVLVLLWSSQDLAESMVLIIGCLIILIGNDP